MSQIEQLLNNMNHATNEMAEDIRKVIAKLQSAKPAVYNEEAAEKSRTIAECINELEQIANGMDRMAADSEATGEHLVTQENGE